MKDYTWVLLSFSLALITTLGALILKYIGVNYSKERDTSIIIGLLTAFLAGIISFIILVYHSNKVKKICYDIHEKHKALEILIPIMAVIFVVNVCLTIYTLNKVENPAYAQIIKNTNVVFILILSILIFKSKFNKKCALGVILCMLGIGLIIYHNS